MKDFDQQVKFDVKNLRFGVGGARGLEEDVEKVGRTSGKILTTHLLKPETEQQES